MTKDARREANLLAASGVDKRFRKTRRADLGTAEPSPVEVKTRQ